MNRRLDPDQRRAVVLDALQYGSNKSELARTYAISRSRVYQLLEDAVTDPKGKLREAEQEALFRKGVLGLVG